MEGTAPLEKRGAQQARHESRFGQPGGGSQAGRANTQFQRLGRLVGSLLQVLLLLHCVLRGISPAGCCARRPSPVCWLPRCMKLAHVCGTRVVHGPATVLLLVLLVPCWFPGFCCLASPPTSLPYTMFSHMRTLLHPRHPRPGPAAPTIWPPTSPPPWPCCTHHLAPPPQELGLPVFQAPGEAEAACAALARIGAVHACATFDSDAPLYGAETVYKKLRLSVSLV